MNRTATETRAPRESGQAAVETALITPLFVFILLGVIQLTMMQQARLMTEYAAFNAARAGIVWSLDHKKMERAAMISLLPTMGRVDTIDQLALRIGEAVVKDMAAEAFSKLASAAGVNLQGMKQVMVKVLNPRQADFGGQPEIEFDTKANRLRTQLVVRVVYLYELRIPFANWIMFESWYAGQSGYVLGGINPANPELKKGSVTVVKESGLGTRLGMEMTAIKAPLCRYNGLNATKLRALGLLAMAGRYMIPITATYTMRMQSNPFNDPKNKDAFVNDSC